MVLYGRPFAALIIEQPSDRSPLEPRVEHRLQTLANLMAVALQRGRQARELERAQAEIARLNSGPAVCFTSLVDSGEFEDIIGDSPSLRTAMARVQEVAATDASVVLLGETGTGKELFARAIHERSARRGRPFVRVNCAALPPTLIESELFGHERGAFTGAVSMRQGRFELADRGTLFLDEIGDLPPDVQAKLLRVLQEGEFERVGVVAVTQGRRARRRGDASQPGGGRRRGRVPRGPLLPPQRVSDRAAAAARAARGYPALVWFFVNRRQRALNRKFTSIPRQRVRGAREHSWPGNVRELQT